ncbi:MAG TPA: hypothetical protein VNF91_09095 [Candidatus Acidoferrum sp.]|nr:hypothetical protein [Candidatus Acidoferrum sp.]
MAQRKTLTEKQVELLRWVASGCPEGVLEGEAYRISAAALRNRGLLTTWGRGPTWGASITPAGTEYLARVDGPDPPIPRQANTSLTQRLVDDVVAAGGVLRVPRRGWGSRSDVDYEQRARIAQLHGKTPPGMRLTTRYVESELEIRLEDAIPGTEVALRPVPVPKRVTSLHPVAQQFRDNTASHFVSRTQLPRCVRVIHALATEAERRGFSVSIVQPGGERARPQRSDDGHLVISIRGHAYGLKVVEEKVSNRGAFDAETAYRRRVNYPEYLKPRTRTRYDQDGTGRLQISCNGYGDRGGRPATWADRNSWALEDKLPALLRELEVRAAEDDYRAIELQREAERRERERELALEAARQRFLEQHRAQILREQVAAWLDARAIRDYLALLEERYGDREESVEWIDWIHRYVDQHVDPLASPPRMPPEPEVSPHDLRPFL